VLNGRWRGVCQHTEQLYADGGRLANGWTNRAVIYTRLTLKSVNGPPFTVAAVATNLIGQTGTVTYTDTNAMGNGSFFYRVWVGE
jgi:hypothetical protein